MQTNAIIVFTKNPQQGNVKTRLAATIGQQKACSIYDHLLQETTAAIKTLRIPVYVFYADDIPDLDYWSPFAHQRRLQSGNDLGARMMNAFEHVFSDGLKNVCIVGCDTLDLTAEYILRAFRALETCNVVIAPTFDGGYLLLGMKELHVELFVDMTWSVPTVFQETIQRLNRLQLKTSVLEKIRDIDVFDDLIYYPALLRILEEQES